MSWFVCSFDGAICQDRIISAASNNIRYKGSTSILGTFERKLKFNFTFKSHLEKKAIQYEPRRKLKLIRDGRHKENKGRTRLYDVLRMRTERIGTKKMPELQGTYRVPDLRPHA